MVYKTGDWVWVWSALEKEWAKRVYLCTLPWGAIYPHICLADGYENTFKEWRGYEFGYWDLIKPYKEGPVVVIEEEQLNIGDIVMYKDSDDIIAPIIGMIKLWKKVSYVVIDNILSAVTRFNTIPGSSLKKLTPQEIEEWRKGIKG